MYVLMKRINTANANTPATVIDATTTYVGERLEERKGATVCIVAVVRGRLGDPTSLETNAALDRAGGVQAADRLRIVFVNPNSPTRATYQQKYEVAVSDVQMFAHLSDSSDSSDE